MEKANQKIKQRELVELFQRVSTSDVSAIRAFE